MLHLQAAVEVINERFSGLGTSYQMLMDEIVVEKNASVLRLSKILCERIETQGYSAVVGPRHRPLRLVADFPICMLRAEICQAIFLKMSLTFRITIPMQCRIAFYTSMRQVG